MWHKMKKKTIIYPTKKDLSNKKEREKCQWHLAQDEKKRQSFIQQKKICPTKKNKKMTVAFGTR